MKNIIVTGASSGIGKELAISLSKEYNVIACSRKYSVLKEIEKENKNIQAIELDITDNRSIESFLNKISNLTIKSLINCAGGPTTGPRKFFFENTKEDIIKSFDLNAASQFSLIKEILPKMKKEDSPIVLNIGSILGHKLYANSGPYNISKQSLSTITKLFRKDLSHLGIRVTEIILSSVYVNDNFLVKHKSLKTEDVYDLVKYLLGLDSHVNIDQVFMGHIKEVFI